MTPDDLRDRFEAAGNELVPAPGSVEAVKSRARQRTLGNRVTAVLAALLLIAVVAIGTTFFLSSDTVGDDANASVADPTVWASNGLVEAADFVYVGSFEVPEDQAGLEEFSFGGSAVAYNPAGEGSLFITGFARNEMVAEISIPQLRRHEGERDGLIQAEVIQPFADITEGRGLSLIGSSEVGGVDDFRIGGLEVIDGVDGPRLHWTAWQVQNVGFNDVPGHGHSSLDLSSPDVEGPWFLGDFTQYQTSGYLFDVPDDFADLVLDGNSAMSGFQLEDFSSTSDGPPLFAFSPPSSSPAQERLDVIELANFERPEASSSFGEEVIMSGGDWITTSDNRNAVALAGNAMRAPNNLNCRSDAPEQIPSTGPQIALYDPSDLVEVAAGVRLPSEVEPYEIFSLTGDVIPVCGEQISGISYDAENGRLFVVQERATENALIFDARPVIHVFSIR